MPERRRVIVCVCVWGGDLGGGACQCFDESDFDQARGDVGALAGRRGGGRGDGEPLALPAAAARRALVAVAAVQVRPRPLPHAATDR